MKDSIYVGLRRNPPKLEVKKDAREVIITTISCMCDNEHTLKFRKNKDNDNDFRLFTGSSAYSNWQIKHKRHELEWAADAQNWIDVFNMINTGTEAIQKVISR